MTTKTFITICLFGLLAPSSHAQQNSAEFISVCSMEEEEKLPLQAKTNNSENGEPNPRTLIPEVTMEDYTLHFITPCYGCAFRLVQNDTVCYSIEITGNTLTIPSSLTGTYELQIVSGDYIFYTEVVL